MYIVETMREVQISKFQATLRSVLDQMGKTREPVLLTRFGKPVARIFPPPDPVTARLGAMKKSGKIKGDIVAPVVDWSEWEVLK
ncbi:MAG: type II toxin-antitoxin system Phd/YefM family antitoxin [Gammaproteobacteria bacterium]|nr:type II toxin-antitoxin system Phd/YefM family antitoxin [Gammaproteobacteria bacterium]